MGHDRPPDQDQLWRNARKRCSRPIGLLRVDRLGDLRRVVPLSARHRIDCTSNWRNLGFPLFVGLGYEENGTIGQACAQLARAKNLIGSTETGAYSHAGAPPQGADRFTRRCSSYPARRRFCVDDRSIKKSSSFLPGRSCALNQRGFFPRPDQVSEGRLGLRYFGFTGG